MREVCKLKAGRFIFRSYSRSSRSFSEISKPITANSSVFENINVDERICYLKKDGFALGFNLPQAIVQEIYEFALDNPCYGNRKPNLGFYYADKLKVQANYKKSIAVGSYYNTASLCPAIKKLESDPILLEIAAKYLEATPVHQGNQLWWSFPVDSTIYERRRAAQVFYTDSDEARILKFFFYLTDVDLCSSPRVCVRGSHLKKKLSHLFLRKGRSHQEIAEYYGYENIVPLCGKAGFGFVEDSNCFYKATPPGSKERLVLQIEFADKDYKRQNDLIDASQLECISKLDETTHDKQVHHETV
jgi:hypothetical protein